MRHFASLAMAFCVVAASAVPAAPAAAKGAELGSQYLNLGASSRALHQMIACLINRNPELARRVLAQPLQSAEQAQLTNDFFEDGGGCLFIVAGLRTDHIMALGTLADELMMKDGVEPASRPRPATSTAGGGSFEWVWVDLPGARKAQIPPLADCLVEQDPVRVEAVLSARPTSSEERSAFNAMADSISDCIPAGRTRTLQPMILRAALALSYYHAAHSVAVDARGSGE